MCLRLCVGMCMSAVPTEVRGGRKSPWSCSHKATVKAPGTNFYHWEFTGTYKVSIPMHGENGVDTVGSTRVARYSAHL